MAQSPSGSVPGTGRGKGYRDAKVPLSPEHLPPSAWMPSPVIHGSASLTPPVCTGPRAGRASGQLVSLAMTMTSFETGETWESIARGL